MPSTTTIKDAIRMRTVDSCIVISNGDSSKCKRVEVPIFDISTFKRVETRQNLIYYINCGSYSVKIKNPSECVENWIEMCMRCYADRLPTARFGFARRARKTIRG